jgi:hypothetical protein
VERGQLREMRLKNAAYHCEPSEEPSEVLLDDTRTSFAHVQFEFINLLHRQPLVRNCHTIATSYAQRFSESDSLVCSL